MTIAIGGLILLFELLLNLLIKIAIIFLILVLARYFWRKGDYEKKKSAAQAEKR